MEDIKAPEAFEIERRLAEELDIPRNFFKKVARGRLEIQRLHPCNFGRFSNPSNGTVTLDGATATYTSTSDTATSDSFTFKVNDGTIDSDPATVTINITNVIPDLSDISLDKSTVEESGKVVLTATI